MEDGKDPVGVVVTVVEREVLADGRIVVDVVAVHAVTTLPPTDFVAFFLH